MDKNLKDVINVMLKKEYKAYVPKDSKKDNTQISLVILAKGRDLFCVRCDAEGVVRCNALFKNKTTIAFRPLSKTAMCNYNKKTVVSTSFPQFKSVEELFRYVFTDYEEYIE